MKCNYVLLILLFPFFSIAQNFEAGLMLGASGYQGDITPGTSALSTGQIHPMLGLFGRYNVNKFITVKVCLNFGKVSGKDAQSSDAGRLRRNLSFESSLTEFSVTGEWNILGFDPDRLNKRFSPYLFGGIAVFHFNPETNYNGNLIELQPLGTEGQGMEGFEEKYRLTQISIPFGAGVKFAISERINIGMEVGIRKTFTDYIDDVSTNYVNYNQLLAGNGELAAALGNRTGEYTNSDPVFVATGAPRGNPDNDDWYFMGGLTLSYNFMSNGSGMRGSGKDFGCPSHW